MSQTFHSPPTIERRRTAVVPVLIAVTALMWTGCASSEIGLPPIENDVEIGSEFAERVESEMGLYDAPELRAYLQSLVEQLTPHAPDDRFQYKIAILDQPEPNAFALPGGFLYVSRGLLVTARSEDELVGSIGHEMAHVYRRHTARQLAKERIASPFKLPGKLVGFLIHDDIGDMINLPANLFGGVILNAFSRQDEYDADDGGIVISASAGYRPRAMGALLSRMEAQSELLSGRRRRPGFFDTHPMTPNRVQRIDRRSDDVVAPTATSAFGSDKSYLDQIEGLLAGENPAQGVLVERSYLHPSIGYVVTFPDGWAVANAPDVAIAIAEESDGFLLVRPLEDGGEPTALAEERVTELDEEFDVTPERNESVNINGWQGHIVTIREEARDGRFLASFLWVKAGDTTLQLLAFGSDQHEEKMAEALTSVRPMDVDGDDMLFVGRVQIVEAKDGESLIELGARSGNRWSPRMTAIMNDLSVDDVLSDGMLIKTVRYVPFIPSTTR